MLWACKRRSAWRKTSGSVCSCFRKLPCLTSCSWVKLPQKQTVKAKLVRPANGRNRIYPLGKQRFSCDCLAHKPSWSPTLQPKCNCCWLGQSIQRSILEPLRQAPAQAATGAGKPAGPYDCPSVQAPAGTHFGTELGWHGAVHVGHLGGICSFCLGAKQPPSNASSGRCARAFADSAVCATRKGCASGCACPAIRSAKQGQPVVTDDQPARQRSHFVIDAPQQLESLRLPRPPSVDFAVDSRRLQTKHTQRTQLQRQFTQQHHLPSFGRQHRPSGFPVCRDAARG